MFKTAKKEKLKVTPTSVDNHEHALSLTKKDGTNVVTISGDDEGEVKKATNTLRKLHHESFA